MAFVIAFTIKNRPRAATADSTTRWSLIERVLTDVATFAESMGFLLTGFSRTLPSVCVERNNRKALQSRSKTLDSLNRWGSYSLQWNMPGMPEYARIC